jgi:ABC-type dipeptide/oligopeptide/nickel transport system permease component
LTGEIKERLLLNHLIIIQNVFGVEGSTRMLFTRVNPRSYNALKTLLVYTSAMPKIVRGIRGQDIISSNIELDNKLVDILRKL